MFNWHNGILLFLFWTSISWCPANEKKEDKEDLVKITQKLFTLIKEGGCREAHRLLLTYGQDLDLNARDEKGITLLNYAVAVRNNLSLIWALLQRGANIDAANTGPIQRWTPLHVVLKGDAEWGCSAETLEILLQHNPNVNSRDEKGAAPLHFAAAYTWFCCVQMLIDCYADVNACDQDRRTPLHWAAIYANITSAEALLCNYANVDPRDCDRQTPLHCAAWTGSEEMINLLLDCGADINAIDLDGDTPLHNAVFQNHIYATKVLFARGADTQLRNKLGYRPFELARGSKTREEFDAQEKKRCSTPPSPSRKRAMVPATNSLPNNKRVKVE